MIINFKLFETYYNDPFSDEIASIIKKSGYKVSRYEKIYLSTIESNKEKYIDGIYYIEQESYGDLSYYDVLFFEKINDNPNNYRLEEFYYSIERLRELFNGNNVLNYKELPFFDELREVLKKAEKTDKIKDFNI